eukprot:142086-Pyramimonas_sp.AAC.1
MSLTTVPPAWAAAAPAASQVYAPSPHAIGRSFLGCHTSAMRCGGGWRIIRPPVVGIDADHKRHEK